MAGGWRVALLLAALVAGVHAAQFEEAYVTTSDTNDVVELQGTVATNGRTALATTHSVYVFGASEENACAPVIENVVALPIDIIDPSVIIMYPRDDTLRVYACMDEPKYFGLWIYTYSTGKWALDEKNTIDNTIWWSEDTVHPWVGVQMVDSSHWGGVQDGWFAVLTDPEKISVMVFRDELVHSGQWESWFLNAPEWDFTDQPTIGVAPTGSAFTFGGTITAPKTGVSLMLLFSQEQEHSTHPGYEHHVLSSFYVSPPQLVLINADTIVGGFREVYWLQVVDGESLALHWIGDEGKWFGPSPADSMRSLPVDTRGGRWGAVGRHFPARAGHYDAASVAMVFSGTKTATRAHALQFVPRGDGSGAYEIAETATHDMATPLVRVVSFWAADACPRALLIGRRTARGELHPTVLSLRDVGDGAAVRHSAARMDAGLGTSPLRDRGKWCYSEDYCQCPESEDGVAPCGPATCCAMRGNVCYQVSDGGSTNCCAEPPFPNVRQLATPCTTT